MVLLRFLKFLRKVRLYFFDLIDTEVACPDTGNDHTEDDADGEAQDQAVNEGHAGQKIESAGGQGVHSPDKQNTENGNEGPDVDAGVAGSIAPICYFLASIMLPRTHS